MSNSRFLKYTPSEKSKWLRSKHPNAFLLLSLIAENARVFDGLPDGLIPGDAILGDYKAAGLTRQKYKTALAKLEELGIIEIVCVQHVWKKPRKLTTKITINSTLVNLKDSSVWDININIDNQHINHRATTEQPPSNHKQERKERRKKEEESTSSTYVTLEDKENFELELFKKNEEAMKNEIVVAFVHYCGFLKKTIEPFEFAKWLKFWDKDRVERNLVYSINKKTNDLTAYVQRSIMEDYASTEKEKKNETSRNFVSGKVHSLG